MIPAAIPGGGGTTTTVEDVFTATTGQTTYALSLLATLGVAIVAINGLLQPKTEYSQTTTQVIFNNGTGIVSGDTITIFYQV